MLNVDNNNISEAEKNLFEALKLCYNEMKLRFDTLSYLEVIKWPKEKAYKIKRMIIYTTLVIFNCGLIFDQKNKNKEAMKFYK